MNFKDEVMGILENGGFYHWTDKEYYVSNFIKAAKAITAIHEKYLHGAEDYYETKYTEKLAEKDIKIAETISIYHDRDKLKKYEEEIANLKTVIDTIVKHHNELAEKINAVVK